MSKRKDASISDSRDSRHSDIRFVSLFDCAYLSFAGHHFVKCECEWVISDIHEWCNLLFKLIVEGLGQCLEWLVDVAALHGAHLTEFKTDTHGKGVTILRRHLQLRVQVHLVSNYDTRQLLARILLLDACVPVMQKSEWLGVCGVVHEHDLVCFAQQVQSDVLEDVLASNIDHM